jgi:hypothetical protein
MHGRAVAGLEINTFEERRAIYNRARAAQSYTLGRRAVFDVTDLLAAIRRARNLSINFAPQTLLQQQRGC